MCVRDADYESAVHVEGRRCFNTLRVISASVWTHLRGWLGDGTGDHDPLWLGSRLVCACSSSSSRSEVLIGVFFWSRHTKLGPSCQPQCEGLSCFSADHLLHLHAHFAGTLVVPQHQHHVVGEHFERSQQGSTKKDEACSQMSLLLRAKLRRAASPLLVPESASYSISSVSLSRIASTRESKPLLPTWGSSTALPGSAMMFAQMTRKRTNKSSYRAHSKWRE
jgi:hypothetical protein